MFTPGQTMMMKFFSWIIRNGFYFFWCIGLAFINSKIFGYDYERIQGLGIFMAWVLLKAAFPDTVETKYKIIPVAKIQKEDNNDNKNE